MYMKGCPVQLLIPQVRFCCYLMPRTKMNLHLYCNIRINMHEYQFTAFVLCTTFVVG